MTTPSSVGFGPNAGPTLTTTGPIFLEAIVQATVTVGANVMPPGFRVPATCRLKAVFLNVSTAPQGAPITVAIYRGGDLAATVSLAAGTTAGAIESLDFQLEKNDMLKVDVTSKGSTTAGSNLLVSIEAY